MHPSKEFCNPELHGAPVTAPSYLHAQSMENPAPPSVCTTMFMTSQSHVVILPQTIYNDYLGFSIMNILCCCLPIGIFAAIFSCKTREAMSRGDMAAAASNSRTSFILNMVALGVGIALNLTLIAVIVSLTFLNKNYYG